MADQYWHICAEEALSECGFAMTDEQVAKMAACMERASGMRAESTGAIYIPDPIHAENRALKAKLKIERDKITCKTCRGKGVLVEPFGPSGRVSISQCHTSHGEGRHTP